MVKMHNVTDSFSEGLMKSIPKKVFGLLSLMERGISEETNGYQEIENLRIFYDSDLNETGGSIILGREPYFKITWEGRPSDAKSIAASDECFLDLAHNLGFFTTVEKLIYGPLERAYKEYLDSTVPTIDVDRVMENYRFDRAVHEN